MRLANAPVSFGIYGLEDGREAGGVSVARVVAELGYRGIDSGPIGLFGDDRQASSVLGGLGLGLCGGWIDLPFSDDDAFAQRLPELERALDFFERADESGLGPVRPMLADSGAGERAAHPGSGRGPLSSAAWGTFERNMGHAVAQIRKRGLSPTFHHHVGTYVETVEEIDRFLTLTDAGLTLDTGHLLMAGGDPVAALDQWRDRVDHVHLKDVDLAVFRSSVAAAHGMRQMWTARPFVPLGRGALDVAGFMNHLTEINYDGWLVVEQDVVIHEPADRDLAIEDQRTNRIVLSPWFPMA